MYKPHSLRKHLSAAVRDLQRDPDKLSIIVRRGHVVCAGEASLSFEYRYTVQIVVLDYAGAADAITVPILVWMRSHHPEYFNNEVFRERSFRFEADYKNSKTIDLSIELDLTERVIVKPQPVGGANPPPGCYTIAHIGEPLRVGQVEDQVHWELRGADGELLSDWDWGPQDTDDAPRLAD